MAIRSLQFAVLATVVSAFPHPFAYVLADETDANARLRQLIGGVVKSGFDHFSGADAEVVAADFDAMISAVSKAQADDVSKKAYEVNTTAFNAFAAAHTTMEPYVAPQLTKDDTPYNQPLVLDFVYDMLIEMGVLSKVTAIAVKQFADKYINLWAFNWFTHKEQPEALNKVADVLEQPLLNKYGFERINVLEASDDHWKLVLSNAHPNCPERLKGLYWMQDNVAAELLVSFHDADWSNPEGLSAYGLKPYSENWSRDATVFGTILSYTALSLTMSFAVSENFKWIELDPETLIYVPSDDEVLMLPDTRANRNKNLTVPFDATQDLMRVSLNDPYKLDSTDDIWYQYRVRRVAYLDADGALVKTAAWDEMAGLMNTPLPNDGLYATMSWEKKLENQLVLGAEQLMKIPGANASFSREA